MPRDIDPGIERQRLLMDGLNGKLDAADQELARAAVRTVIGSPLLDRQLAPMKSADPSKSDLAVGFLEREWQAALGAESEVVQLTQRTTQKHRNKHGNLTLGEYREVLSSVLRDAQVVVGESGHWGRGAEDLVFFLIFRLPWSFGPDENHQAIRHD